MGGYCKLKMVGLEIVAVVVGLVLVKSSNGVSVSCMMAYDEGGAPAAFKSEECFQWLLSAPNQTTNCQFSQLQGLRKYQEDRISCHLHFNIPLLGFSSLSFSLSPTLVFLPIMSFAYLKMLIKSFATSKKEVTVGIIGVFDGHGGKEASEMASNCLSDYFYLHSVFKMYKLMLQYTVAESESLHLEVLKQALLSSIHDIDTKFTQASITLLSCALLLSMILIVLALDNLCVALQEAVDNNFFSGSTATVVVMFNGLILVANVGDSKALLFSEKIQSSQGPQAFLSAIELTKDHHPDRDDERARIEAAGGSVITWGVPRVNGILAMSRSIGDVYLKRYGVIAVPELTGWRPLAADDKYLMVASDGIFESLTANDVRDLILEWDSHAQGSSVSLAEFIVRSAYEKGSTDNLSAIVIPLR
ncbi:hypothetical protein EZV62_010709 [Acer yangbiense]|uniref:protein-serine/threonine phosphatase n=1 Tax=Acer yangbiense TaxID=1000413 RepID=A0A5C7I3M1_9ROSI|nr:hypothetical protein EZV62_010709 [Acer yangbiense]